MAVHLLTPELRTNFRHLYADIFWFGVLAGSTLSFVAVFATRLGATGFQISLLTAGPGVVNLLFSLPAGRWLEGRPLIRASFWSAVLSRFGYLVLIPLPLLLGESPQIWAIVIITLIMSVPGTLLAIGFNALFADVVPPDWRGEVVGRRNAIVAVSMTVSVLLSGQLLDMIIFPYNYQIVFGLGALGALLSTYHVGRLRGLSGEPPERVGRPIRDQASSGWLRLGGLRLSIGLRFLTRSQGKPLLRPDLLNSSFGLLLATFLAFYAFQYTTIPLFPLFQVRVLDLTDSAISLGSSLFYAVMFLASLRLSSLSARYGHRRVMVFGALIFIFYPLLLGLATDATLFWIASIFGGAAWAIVSAGMINRLMEVVPDDERPAYMALHNLVLNLGILSGSLLGPALGEWIGLREAILLGAGLRLLAGVLLWIWG